MLEPISRRYYHRDTRCHDICPLRRAFVCLPFLQLQLGRELGPEHTMEDARQRPAEIEIDEIRERMHDRKARDHCPRDPRLGVRADQPVLGGDKRGGEESEPEGQTFLPHGPPDWLTANLSSELIAERGMID